MTASTRRENFTAAEVNIHLRARSQGKYLVDGAAEFVEASCSEFMMASVLKEAKNILLDRSTVYANAKTFQQVTDWMDAEATPAEAKGVQRIPQGKDPWQGD